MRLLFALLCSLTIVPLVAHAESPPTLSATDRIRLAETAGLAEAIGDKLWDGWQKAPFAILLIAADHEFLVRHSKPSEDFSKLGKDSILDQDIWYRKRKFSPNLLATFPAVGGVPTIVVGQAEKTMSKTSTRWVVTLLHEHFHQLQNAQPRYFAEVDALGLAKGDTTGMWMLNYDFPYTKPEVKDQYGTMSKALADTLKSRAKDSFSKNVKEYLEAKKKFRSLLSADDYKYFAFQCWQEGIARYTEYHVANWASNEYKPSKQFVELKDFTSFTDEAKNIVVGIESELTELKLDKAKRTVFYAMGAAEGLVLDAANPDWRKRYFEERFSLDKHFKKGK